MAFRCVGDRKQQRGGWRHDDRVEWSTWGGMRTYGEREVVRFPTGNATTRCVAAEPNSAPVRLHGLATHVVVIPTVAILAFTAAAMHDAGWSLSFSSPLRGCCIASSSASPATAALHGRLPRAPTAAINGPLAAAFRQTTSVCIAAAPAATSAAGLHSLWLDPPAPGAIATAYHSTQVHFASPSTAFSTSPAITLGADTAGHNTSRAHHASLSHAGTHASQTGFTTAARNNPAASLPRWAPAAQCLTHERPSGCLTATSSGARSSRHATDHSSFRILATTAGEILAVNDTDRASALAAATNVLAVAGLLSAGILAAAVNILAVGGMGPAAADKVLAVDGIGTSLLAGRASPGRCRCYWALYCWEPGCCPAGCQMHPAHP